RSSGSSCVLDGLEGRDQASSLSPTVLALRPSDCRSNRTNAVFRGVAIEFGRCLQQSRRIGLADETFGHELAKSPRGPIQCVIAAGGFPDNNVEGLSNAALITAGPWNETQYFSIKRFRKLSPDRRGHKGTIKRARSDPHRKRTFYLLFNGPL